MSDNSFRAFIVEHTGEAANRALCDMTVAELGPGDVVIRVEWSGINYKDGLASIVGGNVARLPALIPGIDLAGIVVSSTSPDVSEGEAVLVHGNGLGVSHHGGFAEYARVPAEWVIPIPAGLSAREVMSLGTAGFTAALSVMRLEERGLRAGTGPVLVTGATGGVGSVAVGILAARGYEVIAATGKESGHRWLTNLGAAEVISRDEAAGDSKKPLQGERWAGAVDCVGGAALANTLSTLKYGAAVAASGNTGGATLSSTVFPFILRGVALLGIDSVQCGQPTRTAVWARLATDLRPNGLAELASEEVGLAKLSPALDRILAGESQGRTLVRVAG